MNLSIGLSLTRPSNPLGAPAFSPASLFASGEEGAWYDPSDLTTLYQDSKGLTAAGVGDPVGLMLDKSKGGLSATELVINGTFDTDTDWTKGTGWTIAGGVATHAVGTTSNLVSALPVFTAGETHQVSITVSGMTPGPGVSLTVFSGFGGSASSQSIIANGSFSVILVGGTTDQKIYLQATSSFDGSVDNVSVKELPGNHATQSTSTARPTLQTSGGLYYLDFDGGDDWLRTTFSANQAQPNTIAAAFKFDQGARLEFLVDGVGSARNTLYKVSTQLALFAGLGITDPTAAGTSERVVLGHLNTTSSDMRLDGSSVITGSVGNNQWGGITLGATSSGSSWLDGRIYGFIGVNRTLIAGEIDDVESYLAAKSGVTL